MGLPEHMLRITKLHMNGLTLGPIRWDGKSNGKPMAAVERPLPMQPVSLYASVHAVPFFAAGLFPASWWLDCPSRCAYTALQNFTASKALLQAEVVP